MSPYVASDITNNPKATQKLSVIRAIRGTMRKVGARGKEIKGTHPAGHVLLQWEANASLGEAEEHESWMGLLPSKWNTDQCYAWRRDPDYGMWSVPGGESA